MIENLVCLKGPQIDDLFVDAHNMKIIETLVCRKGAQIDEFLVVAHNMKIIENVVCLNVWVRSRSFLLTLTA